MLHGELAVDQLVTIRLMVEGENALGGRVLYSCYTTHVYRIAEQSSKNVMRNNN